jgi:hypothetical protein
MKSNINTHNPNKFCFFYHDNSHDTKDYYTPRRKIERLISKKLPLTVHQEENMKRKKADAFHNTLLKIR